MLRAPFSWFGGKVHMRSKLLKMIPDHDIYVEAFGGSAAMLLAKSPSKVEVYNDVDSGLVNFFRVLRNSRQFKRLQFLSLLTPYSREEYQWARETWRECMAPVDRAHRWLLVARMSFAGKFGSSWGYTITESARGMSSSVSRYLASIESLPLIHDRLIRVQVEHQTALEVIKTYDTRRTFFYLDPPYVLSTRRSGLYEYELTDEEHRRLVKVLLGVKGRVMLSGYRNEIYEMLENRGWRRIDFQTLCHAAGRTRHTGLKGKGAVTSSQARVESVWLNYEPAS